ncbi:MAG: DUF2240 family protein [archaeon]|nr:DUF2240 family protein [archaeon]
MMNKLTVCAAAFFRSRGRNFVTGKEFINEISLNLRWMSKSDAEYILFTLVEKNILRKNGDYFQPTFDILSVKNIPIGYKPEQNFVSELRSTMPLQSTKESSFSSLIVEAEKYGTRKEDFISESSAIQDKLGIDILVAGLIILKNNGADVDKVSDIVYEQISVSNQPSSS